MNSVSSGFSVSGVGYSYSLNVSKGSQTTTITPSVAVNLFKNINLNAQTSLKFAQAFTFSTSLGLSYHLTKNKYLGVFLNTSFKNGFISSNCLVFNVSIHGYSLKFPLFIGTFMKDKPCIYTNIAIISAANLLAFGIMKAYASKPTKQSQGEREVKFRAYEIEF